MKHVVLSRGKYRKNTTTPSDVRKFKESNFEIKYDFSATQAVFDAIRKHCEKDFLETGISDEGGYHFWIVRNTGDNCIKIYPEEGSQFATLPKFTLMGDLVPNTKGF